MKYHAYNIIISIVLLILLIGCSPKLKWRFSKEIPLGEISPIGIVYEDDGFWLSDAERNRILKVNFDGVIQEEYKGFHRPMHISGDDSSKIYIPEFLIDNIKVISKGRVKNIVLLEKPDAPAAIDVENDLIAVADFYNHRIILQENDTITILGTEGHGNGKLYYPTDVEIKGSLIYVADAYNNRVQVFDKQGDFIRNIGEMDSINVASGIYVSNTHVYVTDFYGNRLLVYDFGGNLIQELNEHLNKPTDVIVSEQSLYITNYGGNTIVIYKR